ncbi:MAG: hypothetical protein AAGE52_08290 [Myxococcota bacterium]
MLLAAGLVAIISVAAPSPSDACLREWEMILREESVGTSRAERLLSQGYLRRSFRNAGRAYRSLRRNRGEDPARASRIERRLKVVLAVTTVRLDGRVDRRRWRTPRAADKTARTENLRWAVTQLESLDQDDPQVQARLGEAYARLMDRQADAARVLRGLAERDLMPDVYGYAALARTQRSLGEVADANLAAQVCRRRANRAQQGICPAFGPT